MDQVVILAAHTALIAISSLIAASIFFYSKLYVSHLNNVSWSQIRLGIGTRIRVIESLNRLSMGKINSKNSLFCMSCMMSSKHERVPVYLEEEACC
mmetsp:Transcript_1795/g.2678  ORF Transcript_1795/g.2678 Transcript_1795/m.2678 type:complete len:96 (-) Transcript_1795:885-1172(-)